MKFARKFFLAAAAGALSVSLVGLSAPAHAYDSSWGCGGWCKSGGGGRPWSGPSDRAPDQIQAWGAVGAGRDSARRRSLAM